MTITELAQRLEALDKTIATATEERAQVRQQMALLLGVDITTTVDGPPIDKRDLVLAVFKKGEQLDAYEVAKRTGLKLQAVRLHLSRAYKAGALKRPRKGAYSFQ